MNVVVDGIIYEAQATGGISRIFSEILPRMCALDRSLAVTLSTMGHCRQPLPQHAQIRRRAMFPITRIMRPGRLFGPLRERVRAEMLGAALRDGGGAIWHSTYYTVPPRRWQGPEVVMVYDMIHERFQTLFSGPWDDRFRIVKTQAILRADTIVCISEATKRDVADICGVDPSRIAVVPLAHSTVFHSGIGVPRTTRSRPFLLYVGGRAEYKGFDTLVDAYAAYCARRDIDLVAVGGPWSAHERQRLRDHELSDSVTLLSAVRDEELAALYREAVAFVYPSLAEGFGIPLLEAMACGCPVVASRIPSTLEVAGDVPIYFDPGSIEGLGSALVTAVSSGRSPSRIQAGLVRLASYSWDATAAKTLEIYHALS